jgi:DNA-binding cell septation regulator SpoVG
MLGFFSVRLASGLTRNCSRLMRGGEAGFWIAMPSRQLLDPDGNPRLDDKGWPIYTNLVEFADRATRSRFNAVILALIRREHPEAFERE